jgi:hypothetical protein
MQEVEAVEASQGTVSALSSNGTPGATPAVKRHGSRGMLPSTWLGRQVKLSYTDADGDPVETSATLLDWCGCGPVFNVAGTRTLVSWDRIVTVELVAS